MRKSTNANWEWCQNAEKEGSSIKESTVKQKRTLPLSLSLQLHPAMSIASWTRTARQLHDFLTHNGLPRIDELSHKIHGITGKKDSLVVFFVSYAIVVNLFNEIDIVGMQCAAFAEAEDVDEFMTENLDVNRAKSWQWGGMRYLHKGKKTFDSGETEIAVTEHNGD